MTNMYEDLGVPKDVAPEDLKAAFRRAAQTHHPDKGGSEEAFKRVKEAYEVLSDPARRRTYDETGQTTAQPSVEEEAESLLGHIFSQYLDSNETEDPIASMRNVVSKSKTQQTNTLKDQERALKRISKLKGKLVRKDGGVNSLGQILDAKVAAVEGAKAATERSLKVIEVMFKILSQWECQGFEKEPMDKREDRSVQEMMDAILNYSSRPSQGGPYGHR